MQIALAVHVSAGIEEHSHHFQVAAAGGEMNRRRLVAVVAGVRVGPVAQQQACDLELALFGGSVKAGAAFRLAGSRQVRIGGERLRHRIGLAAAARVHEASSLAANRELARSHVASASYRR